jgi:hypothetical protein
MATESQPALRRWLWPAGGRERGPGGPGLTLELDAEAGLTRGEAGGEEFGAATVGTCEGIGDRGGYPGDLGSIPRTGRTRRRWRSFPASRRGRGRHGTAVRDGGRARVPAVLSGERERELGKEERKRREWRVMRGE